MAKHKKDNGLEPSSDWEAQSDADTLMRAGEICADPDRLERAKKCLKKKKKAMRSVQDLIDYRNSKNDDEDED